MNYLQDQDAAVPNQNSDHDDSEVSDGLFFSSDFDFDSDSQQNESEHRSTDAIDTVAKKRPRNDYVDQKEQKQFISQANLERSVNSDLANATVTPPDQLEDASKLPPNNLSHAGKDLIPNLPLELEGSVTVTGNTVHVTKSNVQIFGSKTTITDTSIRTA